MNTFFGLEWDGTPFRLFGPSHLAALAAVLAINIALFFWKNPGETARRRVRYGLAAALLVDEAILHIWYIVNGVWSYQTMLPFHLCAVLIYATSLMLVTNNATLRYRIYELAYFFGIAGALQALLTPDQGIYNFPHWRYLSVFISHGTLVTSAMYMTVVEKYRPTWGSLKRAWLTVHLYAVGVLGLNFVLGSNYLFINRVPSFPSLIDLLVSLLGPWPWYLIGLEVIALILMLLVYLPFAIKDWVSRRGAAQAASM